MSSIYDDLANSDFVNPGQFKAQMQAMGQMEETDGQGADHTGGREDQAARAKGEGDVQLPGPRYEAPVGDHRVGNSSEEFKMRMMALESLKRQNMMKEYNPMDDENEQSLPIRGYKGQDEGADHVAEEARERATDRAEYDQLQPYQRSGQDSDGQEPDHNPQLKEFRFEQLQKQASAERSRFQMQTKERQTIPENDFLDQEDGGRPGKREEEDETPYDLLVKKRNQMIFDDNIQLSDGHQQEVPGAKIEASEPPAHQYGLLAQDQIQKNNSMKNLQEGKDGQDGNTCQFTLNKYDSRSDLRKKVPESAEEFDSQVQTAHFKKQGGAANSGKDGVSNSEYARTNTEQTQRTRAGEQSGLVKSDPKQGHLIDQRAIQASSQFQDGQQDDYQDSAQRKRNIVNKYGHLLDAQHDQKDQENDDTGQFGGKAAGWNNQEQNVDSRLRHRKDAQVDQFKAEELGDSKLGSSPTIRNKGDNESDKINQLLAQLQAPMTMEHLDSYQQQRQMGITETSSQREDYNMNQLELERAHRQMQQSIKQMKLITQGVPSSVDQFSAAQDDQGSVNGQKFGAFGFNGQNSIYELANKVGHQLSSSNLQSITHTDNDNEFQKMLQVEGQSLGSGRYQMMDQKFKGAVDHERDSGAYPGTMTDTTGMINLACSDKPSQPPGVAPQSTKSNSHYDQLKLLMQRHTHKSNQDEKAATGHRSNENFNGKNIPFEHDVQDMSSRPNNLRSESQFVHVPLEQPQPHDLAFEQAMQQQPAVKKQMSLAQRANQAKMAAQRQQQMLDQQQNVNFDTQNPSGYLVDFSQPAQRPSDEYNQNYRKRFDPTALNQQQQYNQMEMMGQQFAQQQTYIQPQMHQNNYHYQKQRPANDVPQNPVVDFSKTDRNSKVEKRKALMAQFDDIPIHQLHKADGYQIRNIDDESEDGRRSRPGQPNDHVEGPDRGQQDDELKNISLKDQAFHAKWKVRLNAFKEINQLFVDYQGPNRALQKEDEMYGDPDNPFELYGPIIQEMIKDNNLTARYEGLNCLFSYIKYGSDIRSVCNTCLAFLLDKIQLNKPNFRDITQRILLMMMHKKQHILPEVLKRFASKTQIQLSFCISSVNQAFQEHTLQVQDSNLKLVFKYTHDLLGHQNKEIRDQSLQLITFVYMNCEDDLNAFCANVKTLRPVQLKELRETLANVEKSKESEFLVRLFDKVSVVEGKRDGNAPGGHGDRSPHGRSKSLGSDKGNQQLGGEDQDGDEPNGQQEVDLLSLLPSNFNEIPYITQINIKRKALEQFNQELEKLWKKQEAAVEQFRAESGQNEDEDDFPCLVKLNKDYSQIYNIITHMLEDANLLVFIEAIRSIEFLAYLLSSSMKQIKAKNFLTLLADKYKEVKTAVLTQLEKTFDALFDNRCLSPQMFFDTLINQIAATHKNPRVRQMVLDRVEIIMEKNYLSPTTGESKNAPQLFTTFKQVKDKLKQIVLKDTNAQVRDAGVSLVGLFKIILQVADCDLLVSEVISQLPKQRQTQIQQRVEMFQQQRQEGGRDGNQGGPPISARFYATGDDQSRQTRSRSRGRSGRSAARGKSAKSTEKNRKTRHSDVSQNEEGHSPHSKSAAGTDQVFLFQTKKAQSNVSSKFQATLSDVILTIKNISQENDRLRTTQIIENLDQALNELAEDEGINECKCPIVTCIFWLFTNYPQKVNFLENERQEAVKALLNFFKKLYCYDRSVSNAPTMAGGQSLELYQAASSLVICYALLHQDNTSHKTISQILNVLMIAASESRISIASFLAVLKQIFTKYDPCPKLIGNGRAIIASHTIYFVADKMDEMLQRAQSLQQEISLTDFEDFRTIAIQLMESPGYSSGQIQSLFSEQDKALLVQALVYFKEKMSILQGKMDPGQNILGNNPTDHQKAFSPEDSEADRSHLQSTSQFAARVSDPTPFEQKPRHLEVIEEIKSNFEKGLLKLKELVGDEQSGRIAPTPFEHKEQIVALLIHITTQGYKSPTEQYKQAYSLKALMWLKEEFIGLQETFQLTFAIMNPYTFARFEERDHSIEKYLLDFWTKDLSLRDCIDRIQYTCKISMVDAESTFFFLFHWLLEKRVFAEDQKDKANWVIEDFRKVAPMIASILAKGKNSEEHQERATTILKFIDVCVDRFGAKKFRDFIEIQLIHDNETCLKFLDIFNEKYHNELPRGDERDGNEGYLVIQNDNLNPVSSQSNRNLAAGAIRETTNTESKESLGEPYLSAHSATGANPSLQQSFNQVTDRSQLLQEMRDRRKISAQNTKTNDDELDFQDTLAREKQKYEEIMKKLENYKSASRQTSSRGGADEGAPSQVPDGQRPVTTDPSGDGKKLEMLEHRQSSTAKHKDEEAIGVGKMNEGAQRTGSARYSNRYEQHREQHRIVTNQDGSTSLQDFNDDEDFKLSADHQQSLAQLGTANGLSQKSLNFQRQGAEGERFMEDRMKMQQFGHRSSKTSVTLGEGLKSNFHQDLQHEHGANMMGVNDSTIEEQQTVNQQQLQESRQKIRQSVQFQEEKLQRLESSQIKVRQFKVELETLHEEKRKLEIEKHQLLSEQNRETEEWKQRYNEMTAKNDEITSSLAEANHQYLRQVSDNEKLTNQIVQMQDEHRNFLERYKELERKLIDSENLVEEQKIKLLEESQKANDPSQSPGLKDSESRANINESQIIEEQSLTKIEKVFDQSQMMRYGDDNLGAIGVKKIQELLLDSEGATQRNLAKPMIFHYQRMKNKVDRMQMLTALKLSLENEDILFAISIDTHKSLLNFLLQVFSFEKELIERESLDPQHERQSQNELTQESQRLVSKLLNSKEFTHSLICLIQLLKNDAMPADFATNLSIQQRHYLRVIMRCTSRITKALHSENPDLIRAFDVLIEMHKLFAKHPPENLRQDLPCLQDFDYVYRGLKEVSDKLIELQPQKCRSFLEFCAQGQSEGSDGAAAKPNAFINYISQMLPK